MGRFAAYLGKTQITVNGEKLELDVNLDDIEQLLSSQKMQGEESVKVMSKVFSNILVRSFPEEPVAELRGFLSKNFFEFMTEFYIYYKWMNRDDLDKKKDELKSQLENSVKKSG